MHAQLVEHRQVKIRERRTGGIAKMTSPLELASSATHEQDREVVRIVRVAVTHAGAVDERGVVEQRAVAVGGRLQPVEEISEQARVKTVDLQELRQLVRIVLVVGNRVVRIGHPISGYCRPVNSRPSMNVTTRVRSA